MHVYYKIHRLTLQFIDIINSLIIALCYKTHDQYLALNLFRIIGFFFYLKKKPQLATNGTPLSIKIDEKICSHKTS